jgi:hypothetical protein
MDSSTLHQSEVALVQTEPHIDSILAIKAQQVGAAFMLPPHELDSPLSAAEILPRFGEPVVVNGVNYTALARAYLAAVSGEYERPQEAQEPCESLAELANTEERSVMLFNAELLRAHDSLAHRKAGIPRFEKYVAMETGKTYNRSTLTRRMVHAKVALIFAAGGAIDILPSQNQANLLGQLPRHVWLPCWRDILAQNPNGKVGKAALEKAVPLYATRHQLPLRGERLDSEQGILPLEDVVPTAKSQDDTPVGLLKTEDIPVSRQEADQQIIKLLDPILQNYLPRRARDRLKKKNASLGRQYLSAVRTAVRKTPSPTKNDNRSDLFNAMAEHHPVLGKEILRLMLGLAFQKIDEKLK